ncbi:MAG: UvrD-helicase domain-containing protein [Candidatus Omnitrophica bacterium]|nr:UvrD-helicase domain-containing protein [Candidatus Omnitrophota bacterium]
MTFTEEQKRAVKTQAKRVCVSAAAGSGKTSVLVAHLMEAIVSRTAGIHEILAITFTNKAADEIKRRVARQLRDLQLTAELRELENAYVSTIDSFCARVLKEHPIEAGVDANFSVITENDAAIAIDQILGGVLQDLYAEKERIKEFMARYGAEGIEQAVRMIYQDVRAQGGELREAFSPAGVNRDPMVRKCISPVEAVLSYEKFDEEHKYLEIFNALRDVRNALTVLVGSAEPTWDIVNAFKKLCGNSKIRKPRSKKDIELRLAIERFQKCSDLLFMTLVEESGKDDLECLEDITLEFARRYEAWKRDRAMLDFGDLLLKTFRLFSSASYGAAHYYKDKFKLVMIDEYQDTSPVQDKILNGVAGSNQVFLVGDEKQSIYGFRNADVGLFRKRRREFSETDPIDGCLGMATNFRSSREIINFINDFFAEIWSEDGMEVDFHPLEFGRAGINEASNANAHEASVEWVIAGNSFKGGEEDQDEDEDNESITLGLGRLKEAKLVAARLKRLVEIEQMTVFDKSNGTLRRVRYGDVAILFRTRTALTTYERALREEDLPYVALGGDGFYHQPEIRDVISFLDVLENPTFDIPLAGVLRSPFAGCSDEAFFWLSKYAGKRENKHIPLFNAVQAYERIQQLNEKDKLRIGEFLAHFEKMRAAKNHLSIADLIGKIIRESRYDLVILGERSGRRKFANLRKLMDIAGSFEERNTRVLSDFIRYLRELEIRQVEEGEALVVSEADDVIRLMTIHKAKGLEFPVVVVADMGGKLKQGGRELTAVDREGRIAMRVKNPLTGTLEKTLSFFRFEEERRRRERDELKRLLYVAVTRAREKLIFAGANAAKELDCEKGYGELVRWMDWLKKVFGWNGRSLRSDNSSMDFKGHKVKIISEKEEAGTSYHKRACLADQESVRATFVEERILDGEKILHGLDRNEMNIVLEQADQLIMQTQLKERPFFETVDISVTSLITYETCPRLFYYKHVIGLPEYRKGSNGYKDSSAPVHSQSGGVSPADLGSVVHWLLESASFNEFFMNQMELRLESLRLRTDARLIDAAREILEVFRASPIFSELAKARRIIREFPFVLRLEHGIVRGNIDLIYETFDGGLVAADYKTGQIDRNEIPTEAALYRAQILLYAIAMNELMHKAPGKAKLFFMNRSWADEYIYSVDSGCLDDFQRHADNMLQKIAASAFLPKDDKLCVHCPAENICRRQAELHLNVLKDAAH